MKAKVIVTKINELNKLGILKKAAVIKKGKEEDVQELADIYIAAVNTLTDDEISEDVAKFYNELGDEMDAGTLVEKEKVVEKKEDKKSAEKTEKKKEDKKASVKKNTVAEIVKEKSKKSEKVVEKKVEKKKEVKKDKKSNIEKDEFGFKKGSNVSNQTLLLKSGKCTMKQIKEKTGSTCYDLIKKLQSKGFSVNKDKKDCLILKK